MNHETDDSTSREMDIQFLLEVMAENNFNSPDMNSEDKDEDDESSSTTRESRIVAQPKIGSMDHDTDTDGSEWEESDDSSASDEESDYYAAAADQQEEDDEEKPAKVSRMISISMYWNYKTIASLVMLSLSLWLVQNNNLCKVSALSMNNGGILTRRPKLEGQGGVSLLAIMGGHTSNCRRRVLVGIVGTSFVGVIGNIGSNNKALAMPSLVQEGDPRMVFTQPPRAPTAALIPALQQRLLLEKCLYLVSKAVSSPQPQPDEQEALFQQVKLILKNLNNDDTTTVSTPKLFFNNNNKDLAVMRQYVPSQVLSGDLVRAAMNIYTSNLQYGTDYTVTDPEWKKSYIRANDGLPDTTKVMAADLDLRDLLRNQVQLKLDDAAAELYLAVSERNDQEVQQLLQDAAKDFDAWLDKIAESDVREALQAVLEGQSVRVYDPYYAGFIPPPPPSSSSSSSSTISK